MMGGAIWLGIYLLMPFVGSAGLDWFGTSVRWWRWWFPSLLVGLAAIGAIVGVSFWASGQPEEPSTRVGPLRFMPILLFYLLAPVVMSACGVLMWRWVVGTARRPREGVLQARSLVTFLATFRQGVLARCSSRFVGEGFVGLVGVGALVFLGVALGSGGMHELLHSERARMGGYLGVELGAIPLAAIAGGLVVAIAGGSVSEVLPGRVAWIHEREWAPLLGGALLALLGVWLWMVWVGTDHGVIPLWLSVVGRVFGGALAAALTFAGAIGFPRLTAALAGVIAGAGLFGLVEIESGRAVFASAQSDEGAAGAALILAWLSGLVVFVVALLCAWGRLLPRPLVLAACSGAVSLVVASTGYVATAPVPNF